MKKVTLLIAQSLDGYVASKDGSVSWLDPFQGNKELMQLINEFLDEIDTVIQGNSTYQQFTPAYPGKKSYVFTKDRNLSADDGTIFVSGDVKSFMDGLDKTTHKNIWLVGGPQLAAQFFNEGLIDQIILHTMPVLLNEGISLFSGITTPTGLKLTSLKSYSDGVVEAYYDVTKKQ